MKKRKINDQHFEIDVSKERHMRRRVREVKELALADGTKTFTATLIHPAASKQATVNLLKDGEDVKYLLLDKTFYTSREVYALMAEILELPE